MRWTDAKAWDYLTLAVLLVAWEVLSRGLVPGLSSGSTGLLPPPSSALLAASDLILTGSLHWHVLASVRRVLSGWGCAALLAIPLGLAMAWWGRLYEHVGLLIEALRPIPPIAWIPLSILWLGIGETQMAFIAGIGAFFAILLSTIHGVRRVDLRFIRAAQCLGAARCAILRKVILRGALPEIFTGLRVGLGLSWMSLVGAELVAAQSGIAFLSLEAQNVLRTDRVILTMVLIAVLGICFDLLLRSLARYIMPWVGERS